jgi:hypothetical protein
MHKLKPKKEILDLFSYNNKIGYTNWSFLMLLDDKSQYSRKRSIFNLSGLDLINFEPLPLIAVIL